VEGWAVQKPQPPADAARERAAWPNGQPSVMNLVDRIADRLGVALDERSRAAAAGVAHHALGSRSRARAVYRWPARRTLVSEREAEGAGYVAAAQTTPSHLASPTRSWSRSR
jgi:hypothetical protein